MNEHVFHTCDKEDCFICNGCLKLCVICNLGEVELTPECPGFLNVQIGDIVNIRFKNFVDNFNFTGVVRGVLAGEKIYTTTKTHGGWYTFDQVFITLIERTDITDRTKLFEMAQKYE